jgi:hypothetical protein
MVQNDQKTGLSTVFGHFEAIWASSSRPEKVLKGPQVGEMYGSMSKLKGKPLLNH